MHESEPATCAARARGKKGDARRKGLKTLHNGAFGGCTGRGGERGANQPAQGLEKIRVSAAAPLSLPVRRCAELPVLRSARISACALAEHGVTDHLRLVPVVYGLSA